MEIRQSDLRKFIECKRKWYLENVLELKPKSEHTGPRLPNNANIGTLVHGGLEAYYTSGTNATEGLAATLDKLMPKDDLTDEEYHSWVKANMMAQLMLDRYVGWAANEGVDEGLQVIESEHVFSYEYDSGVYLTGTSDLIAYDNVTDGLVIFDHKTVAQMNQTPRPNDFQLVHYAWLWWKTQGEMPRSAGHNVLKRVGSRGKGPYTARYLIDISPEMLENHSLMMENLVPEYVNAHKSWSTSPYTVGAEYLLFPNMTGECSWKCRVKDLCDMMGSDSDWQHVAITNYHHKEGMLK